MSLDHVTPGSKLPESFNVIIEISMNGDPIKYEVDKASGCVFVDRFMNTAMHYPTNYGYVPKTIEHFFEHYKDLDKGKWVKVLGWDGKAAAHQEILDGIAAYNKDNA